MIKPKLREQCKQKPTPQQLSKAIESSNKTAPNNIKRLQPTITTNIMRYVTRCHQSS
ncbi:hypothetical protein RHGRI_001450 [Rhododendron griersonianum]|uniref:Uncharacterized protein n=1 Tax=Rhododendron griersonianum TaxID=479676 RepID=A0AAV6LL39_9ERIC|nr:hypothetical protein RHGRI_001450 [Rhododendron griersonianum]